MKSEKAGHHLLVAEDNPLCRLMVEKQLQSLGYDVDIVENGLQALAALDRDRYDLVLMDCQMPELDGYEATRRLRLAGKRLPVIALTAHAAPNVRDKCLAAGMDGFVAKGFATTELTSMLHTWLPSTGESNDIFAGGNESPGDGFPENWVTARRNCWPTGLGGTLKPPSPRLGRLLMRRAGDTTR